MDLTSDRDPTRKRPPHPGPTLMRYDRDNPEQYRIDIHEGDMTSTALFKSVTVRGGENIIEGCYGKQTPFT